MTEDSLFRFVNDFLDSGTLPEGTKQYTPYLDSYNKVSRGLVSVSPHLPVLGLLQDNNENFLEQNEESHAEYDRPQSKQLCPLKANYQQHHYLSRGPTLYEKEER